MYTYETLCSDIGKLQQYGDIIHVKTLCKTVLGREVDIIKIGNGKKRVLYVGAHHGMEYITSALIMDFAFALCGLIGRGENRFCKVINAASGKRIREKYCFYLIPMLNPDGVTICCEGPEKALAYCDTKQKTEYGRVLKKAAEMTLEYGTGDVTDISLKSRFSSEKDVFKKWQANGRGVDLNHNYQSGFAEYKSLELKSGRIYPSPTRFSGAYPESEPESSALCSLIRASEVSLLLTFHSQGKELYGNDFFSGGNTRDYIFSRSGCDPLAEVKEDGTGVDILRRTLDGYRLKNKERSVGRFLEKESGYARSVPTGAAAYGGLTDWYTEEFRRAAYTVEVGHGSNPLPMSMLDEIKKDLLYPMLTAPTLL